MFLQRGTHRGSQRVIQRVDDDNVYTMLLNKTLDTEPPLITRLRGIGMIDFDFGNALHGELTDGFCFPMF